MSRVSFQEFADTVAANIRDHLPESYRDAEVKVTEFQKLNESYLGMTVRQEGQTVVPNINLTAQYETYLRDGADMDAAYRRIADQVQLSPDFQTAWLSDYDEVKSHLFIRVSDARENEDFLSSVPHKTVDGLAVSYHIAMPGPEGAMASTVINNQMLESYGISQDQLHEDAVKNAQEMLPARFTSMAAMMMGLTGMDVDLMEEAPPGMPQLMVLTNEQGMNGASVLFYPGQLDAVANNIHSDFFVLPSSIHETLILADDGLTDYRDLQTMVQQINQAEVAPNERLSDHVYHYDAADHVLERAETFENRMKARAREAEKAKLPEKEKTPETERKSVLQRLSDKKAQVALKPKKNAPSRAKDMALD